MTEDLLELDEFKSDDGEHHVFWAEGPAGYPVWFCKTHEQPYFNYCMEAQVLADKALEAQKYV